MSIAKCQFLIASNGQELVQHGTTAYPLACYHDDLGFHEVPWHWHEELEAVVIASGCCTVATDSHRFTCREGEGFFINSSVLHGCWDLENSSCRFHSLVFHPRLVGGSQDSVFYQSFLHPLMKNHALESLHLTPDVPWQAQSLDAIEAAWQQNRQETFGFEFQVRESLSQLVLLLQQNHPCIQAASGSKAQREADRIKTMLHYVHAHAAEAITMADIARSAALSESECLRCFRATVGISPIRYLRQYRIQLAAQLLAQTREPVNTIAVLCGFSDVSYFTKTFREMRGCSPTKFRARHCFSSQNMLP